MKSKVPRIHNYICQLSWILSGSLLDTTPISCSPVLVTKSLCMSNLEISIFYMPHIKISRFDTQNLEISVFDMRNIEISRFENAESGFSRFDMQNIEISRFDKQSLEISRFDVQNLCLGPKAC